MSSLLFSESSLSHYCSDGLFATVLFSMRGYDEGVSGDDGSGVWRDMRHIL